MADTNYQTEAEKKQQALKTMKKSGLLFIISIAVLWFLYHYNLIG